MSSMIPDLLAILLPHLILLRVRVHYFSCERRGTTGFWYYQGCNIRFVSIYHVCSWAVGEYAIALGEDVVLGVAQVEQ